MAMVAVLAPMEPMVTKTVSAGMVTVTVLSEPLAGQSHESEPGTLEGEETPPVATWPLAAGVVSEPEGVSPFWLL